jgi:hypothetical protein
MYPFLPASRNPYTHKQSPYFPCTISPCKYHYFMSVNIPPLPFFPQIKPQRLQESKFNITLTIWPHTSASAVVIPNVVQHSKSVLVSRRQTCLLSPGKIFLTLIKCCINSKNVLTTRSIRTILLSNPHLLRKRQLLTLHSKGLHSRAHAHSRPHLVSRFKMVLCFTRKERAEHWVIICWL